MKHVNAAMLCQKQSNYIQFRHVRKFCRSLMKWDFSETIMRVTFSTLYTDCISVEWSSYSSIWKQIAFSVILKDG